MTDDQVKVPGDETPTQPPPDPPVDTEPEPDSPVGDEEEDQ